MIQITVRRRRYGYQFSSGRRTRYVPDSLMCTIVECHAIREFATPRYDRRAARMVQAWDWPEQTLSQTGVELRRHVVAELSREFSIVTGLQK